MHATKYTQIAKGSFGRIFYPAVPCAQDPDYALNTRLVAKIGCEMHAINEFVHAQWLIKDVEDKPTRSIANTDFMSYQNGVYALDIGILGTMRNLVPSLHAANRFINHLELADGDLTFLINQIDSLEFALSLIELLLQPLKFLARMHDRDYFHFDIKADNILYFRNTEKNSFIAAKICDFAMLASPRHQSDFATFTPFTEPWFNYPPWASLFYQQEMALADLPALHKLETDIVNYFRKPLYAQFRLKCVNMDHYRFCPDWSKKSSMPQNISALASAVDLYGMALILDTIRTKLDEQAQLPASLDTKITHFCNQAVSMQLDPVQAIDYWTGFLK